MKSTFLCGLFILIIPFSVGAQNEIPPYKPVDQQLHVTISHMDRIFFKAYNSCNMEEQKEIYADDMEVFHVKNGKSRR